jgi:hypothetical protein
MRHTNASIVDRNEDPAFGVGQRAVADPHDSTVAPQ